MQKITKIEAATTLLNTAIRLFFAAEEAIAVHSLVASAANIFSDLAEKNSASTSWRQKVATDNNFRINEVKATLHKSWNFLKHADKEDADAVLEFSPKETEFIVFYAILECGDLWKTSIEMQVFQIWFIACNPQLFGEKNEIFLATKERFAGLSELTPEQQLRIGKEELIKELAKGI